MVQAIALIFNIRFISPAAYVAAFSCTKCHCQKLIFRGALNDDLEMIHSSYELPDEAMQFVEIPKPEPESNEAEPKP